LDQLDYEPKINDCREEFERVDVETVTLGIQGLLSILVDTFHGKAKDDQICAGDTPLHPCVASIG
jgi:hypothetical protein